MTSDSRTSRTARSGYSSGLCAKRWYRWRSTKGTASAAEDARRMNPRREIEFTLIERSLWQQGILTGCNPTLDRENIRPFVVVSLVRCSWQLDVYPRLLVVGWMLTGCSQRQCQRARMLRFVENPDIRDTRILHLLV